MVQIKHQLVSDDKKPKYQIAGGKEVILAMVPEYITIHETDNEAKTATDEAHANLQSKGNSRQASWHIQVDDDSAIQSIPFNECALHAGDGINGKGNRRSIAIEICVNKGGDFKKAVENAVDVTRQLMKQFNIPAESVVQHNHWSGKNCPRHLRCGDWGITWSDFITMIKDDKKLAVKVGESNIVMWDGRPLVQGQIGRLTILKPINLWNRDGNDKLVRPAIKVLAAGEVLPVFAFDEKYDGQYMVTDNEWVTNMSGYVKYETPSKTKLDLVNK